MYLLNGLFILGVVINHSAGWGTVAMFCWAHRYLPVTSPDYSQVGSLAYYLIMAVRQLTAISVAGFLFSAGIFLVYAGRGSQKISWKFVFTRILGFSIPYLIWSIIIFIQILITEKTSYSIWGYLRIFLTTGADGPYYYVPLIVYFYLLSPFLIYLAKKYPAVLLAGAAFLQIGSALIRYLSFLNSSPTLDFLIKITPDWSIPRWVLFFSLGLVVGFNMEKVKIWLAGARKWLGWVTILAAIAAFVEPELIYRLLHYEWRSVPFPLTHQVYSILAIFLLLTWEVEKTRLAKPLSYLGGRTYGIYLTHHKVMEIVGRLFYHFAPGFLAYQVPLVIIFLVAGLGIPLGMMRLLMMTPARRFSKFIFG